MKIENGKKSCEIFLYFLSCVDVNIKLEFSTGNQIKTVPKKKKQNVLPT